MEVTKNDKRDALTITIDGEQYRTLAKIADALNAAESGHTPESVCRKYAMGGAVQMLSSPRELADLILGDARFEGEEVETAFRRAFIRAGLWGLGERDTVNA